MCASAIEVQGSTRSSTTRNRPSVTSRATSSRAYAAGSLPLLAPMSEVAGKIATQAGAFMLEKPLGGRGLLLGGVPLLLFVVIALLVLVPGFRKGERFTPRSKTHEDQWFGGPRSGTAELAAADTDESEAGGASARW